MLRQREIEIEKMKNEMNDLENKMKTLNCKSNKINLIK